MPCFNLAYEPWIPCLLRGESLPQDLSLLDTLTRAHEIRELSDDSPLVTIALHRLLLAILHRNFGPPGFSEWKRLWQRGQWDGEKLAGYFAEWSEKKRFDLFDAERPFYQVPFDANLKSDPVILLAQELASGNNATLFDHSFSESSRSFTPEQAARFLLSRQAFAFSGTGGYLNSTLVDGYTVLAIGNNLFETLALNLLPYNEESPIPHRKENGQSRDLPIWEQEKQSNKSNEAYALGYLDYLTWQSRSINLIADGEPPTVRECQHLQKLKLKVEQGVFDSFKCYERKNEKSDFRAKQLDKAKVLWRDSHSLFEQAANPSKAKTKRPEVFNHLAKINDARRRREIESQPAYSFAVYGMINNKASVSMWVRERLPLPLGYLTEKTLTSALEDALKLTDAIAKNLSDAIKVLARQLANKLETQAGEKDASRLALSFGAQEVYWSRLESHFKKFLVDLAVDLSADETEYGENKLPEWARTVTQIANTAFNQAVNSLSDSAYALQAGAIAQKTFDDQMRKTRKNKSFARFFSNTSNNEPTKGGQS